MSGEITHLFFVAKIALPLAMNPAGVDWLNVFSPPESNTTTKAAIPDMWDVLDRLDTAFGGLKDDDLCRVAGLCYLASASSMPVSCGPRYFGDGQVIHSTWP